MTDIMSFEAFGAREVGESGEPQEHMAVTTESVVLEEIVEVYTEPLEPESLPSVTDSLMAIMEPFAEEISATFDKIADLRERLSSFIAETEQLGTKHKATVDEKTRLDASLHNLTIKVAEYQKYIIQDENTIQRLSDHYQTIERSIGAATIARREITEADRALANSEKNDIDTAYFKLDCLKEMKRNAESKIEELSSNLKQLDRIVSSIEDRLKRIGILVVDYQAEFDQLMGSKAMPTEQASVYTPLDVLESYPVQPQSVKPRSFEFKIVRKDGTSQ